MKTFAETNKIYRFSWKETYYYRLELIPSYNADLSSPDTVDLPKGALLNLSYNWEYKDYYIGIPKLPYLEFDLNLDLLDGGSDTHDFNVFAKLCYENTASVLKNNNINGKPYSVEFEAGNVWRLSKSDDGVTYSIIVEAVQDEKSIDNLDITNGIFSVKTKNIISFIMQQISTNMLYYFMYYFIDYGKTKAKEIDLFYKDFEYDNRKNYCGALPKDYTRGVYQFGKLSEFTTFIQDDLLEIVYQLTVRETKTLTFDITEPTFYKQLTDNTGLKGTAVTDLYIMIAGQDVGTVYFDYENPNYERGVLAKIEDLFPTLNDFIGDWLLGWGLTIKDNYTSTDLNCSSVKLFANSQMTIKDIYFKELEITKNAKRVENVTVSNSDAQGYDIEEVNYVLRTDGDQNSRNDAQLQIQSVFHNTPVWSDKFKQESRSNSILSNTTHDLQLFDWTDEAFRVHSEPKIDFGRSIYSDAITTVTTPINNQNYKDKWGYIYPEKKGSDTIQSRNNWLIVNSQIKNGINYIIAQCYYKFFNHDGQNAVKGKLDLSEFDDGTNNCVFNPDLLEFKINYSEISRPVTTMLGELNTNYRFTKVSLKLINDNPNENDVVEFEALSRYAG